MNVRNLTRLSTSTLLTSLMAASVAMSVAPASSAATVPMAASHHLTIGSILYGVDGYQVAHGIDMQRYGASRGITIKTCNSENSIPTEQKCVDEMISSHVDGVVMQPVDASAATNWVKALQAAKIPVITWAVGPVPKVKVPFVALDEAPQTYIAGQQGARWVMRHWHQTPRMVVVTVPTNVNCVNRMQGFIKGVKSVAPKAVLVAEPNGNGTTLPSENVMANIIQSGRSFNIVTACNSDSVLGTLDALRAAGRGQAVHKVPKTEWMFGIDGTKAENQQLVSTTSPLMEVLGLNPVKNTQVLLKTLLKLVHHKISETYRGNLYDTFLAPKCAAVNKFEKADYGTTVHC